MVALARKKKADQYLLTNRSSFYMECSNPDQTPPELTSVTLGGSYRDHRAGNTKQSIIVSASDNLSGVEHITVTFENASGKIISTVLYVKEGVDERSFTGDLVLKDKQEKGVYGLKTVLLADHEGNRITYSRPVDVKDKGRVLPNE